MLLVSTHPAVAAQLVSMIDALLLSQREAFPLLVEVAQTGVDLPVVHSPLGRKQRRLEMSHRLNARLSKQKWWLYCLEKLLDWFGSAYSVAC